MQKIIFATNNLHKLEEVRDLLGDHFLLLSLKDICFNGEIPENQPTLEGNALEKAQFIYDQFHVPCFADDTGLEIEALNGEPGVYSARYAGPLEFFGSEAKRFEANIDKVLMKLKNITNRKARFRTIIAYIDGTSEHLFEGIVDGTIIDERLGTEGFGYDPVFVPEGYQKTFAEMSIAEKNKISHRARAFANFVAYMKKLV